MKYFASRFLCVIIVGSGLISCSDRSQDELVRQVRELQAKEEIRSLFADYGRTLDERNFSAFARLFSEDAVYLAGGEFIGPEAIAAQLESVITANATGANLHTYSNEIIQVSIEEGSATAISRGAFYQSDSEGQPLPLMFATYRDLLVEDEGVWKFQRREISADIPGQANELRFSTE